MNVYVSIKRNLIKLIKEIYPSFDIFAEEINKTENEDYFFIEIIPISNITVSKYHTDRNLLISITGHTKSYKNEDYFYMIANIDNAIRPVFRFDDRAITVNRADGKIVDRCMMYTFDISFRDNNFSAKNQDDLDLELMEKIYVERN